MPFPTILDIATRAGNDTVIGLIDETTQATPELSGKTFRGGTAVTIPNVGASRTIVGTQYKTRVRTALPTFQFRKPNKGVPRSKSSFENRNVECFLAQMRWEADKELADVAEDGPEAYIAEEAEAQVLAAMQGLAKQFYYGRENGGDADGHPGLIDAVDDAMVTDAQGTTANGKTSIWLVKFGPPYCQWVFGKNGGLTPSQVREGDAFDTDNNPFTAYIQELAAWAGVQCLHRFACSRIMNLTEEDGHTVTDDLIFDNLALWPAGIQPNVIFMTRDSQKNLRKSRTATNATGAPAPLPEDVGGIPIAPTDAILSTEP